MIEIDPKEENMDLRLAYLFVFRYKYIEYHKLAKLKHNISINKPFSIAAISDKFGFLMGLLITCWKRKIYFTKVIA